MNRILVVEDESAIADTIVYALKTEGFVPEWVSLGAEAVARVAEGSYVAMILDVGLPDINGFEVCRRVKERSDVPVLFVTARAEEIDRVVGFEIGADDYVVKPFSPRELVARVRAILRRVAKQGVAAAPPAEPAAAESGPVFRVEADKARIWFRGEVLDLTRYEFLLLKTLLAEPERVFSRAQLLDRVWTDADSMDRTVDAHIKTLRAKLRDVDAEADPIRTHRGLGYSISVKL